MYDVYFQESEGAKLINDEALKIGKLAKREAEKIRKKEEVCQTMMYRILIGSQTVAFLEISKR
jgi:hypothetical protein